MTDASLSLSLGAFGSVSSVSFKRDKTDCLCTGTRLVRKRLDGVIPNLLFVSGYPCFIWYPGQPKKCHVCHHLSAACPNRGLCQICRKPGHVAARCPDKSAGISCPFSWGKPQGVHSDSGSDSGSEDYSSVADGDDSDKLVVDESVEGEAVPSQEEGVSPMNVVPMVEVVEEGDASTPSGSPTLFSSEPLSANAKESLVPNVSDPDPATPPTPSENQQISLDPPALPEATPLLGEPETYLLSHKSTDAGRERSRSSHSRYRAHSSSSSK